MTTAPTYELLLPYQKRWAKDKSRWKFGLMARQVGKDFSMAAEGVSDCWSHENRGQKTEWLIAGPSERQSLESLAKWREWVAVHKMEIVDWQEKREGGPEALLKSSTIVFPHGSRVIAVPGRPDTVRGYSANVVLTEFAFFENPDLTWRAILPSITNPLRGGVKKVRLITTPNGIGNKAHEIWSKNYSVGRDSVEPAPAGNVGLTESTTTKNWPTIPASHGSTESRPTGTGIGLVTLWIFTLLSNKVCPSMWKNFARPWMTRKVGRRNLSASSSTRKLFFCPTI
jgi:hypothetical protein